MDRVSFHRTIWRWHFYAGLFVIPFIIVLAISGAVYLFKPQIERWEERAYQGLDMAGAVSPNRQLDAVLAAYPDARFDAYRLPERAGDAAMVQLTLADGRTETEVFVSPQGEVLGSIDPATRIIAIDQKIHGQLLLGKPGAWLVELAACWAIVMILSGLCLWWPAGRGLAGVVWPRLRAGRAMLWRDLHAVTGFWVSGLALVLLVTGLPWAGVWGDAFKLVRTELGLLQGPQDWTIGGRAGGGGHGGHDHEAMLRMQASGVPMTALADIVAKAGAARLAFPVFVRPPSGDHMVWTVKSEAQNRPLRASISYDMATGAEVSREGFADKHVIDRAVGYGIAWHEGQLFGWINQLVGVLTAVALVTLAATGFIMWRRRKPDGALGAPPLPNSPARMGGVTAILLILAVLLPLLAGSLVLLWLFDKFVLPRLPGLSSWLGVERGRQA